MKYQTNKLYIKHESATEYMDASVFGAEMGEGFIDALSSVAPLKDYLQFSSRVMPGKELRAVPVTDARELTLQFLITADSPAEYRLMKNSFVGFLNSEPRIALNVPVVFGEDQCFHLVYTGKSVTYAESFSHARGVISAKFIEPDPTDRSLAPKTQEYLATEERIKLFGGGAFLVP